MSKELMPCPMCGNPLEIAHRNGGKYVRCITCIFETARHGYHVSDDELKRRCNRRPAEDALKAENERLKEAIKEIRNIADAGLDIGIEFIGAGLDGMTGGVGEWEGMRRSRRKVRKLAKEALKNNAHDTEKGGEDE